MLFLLLGFFLLFLLMVLMIFLLTRFVQTASDTDTEIQKLTENMREEKHEQIITKIIEQDPLTEEKLGGNIELMMRTLEDISETKGSSLSKPDYDCLTMNSNREKKCFTVVDLPVNIAISSGFRRIGSCFNNDYIDINK